MNNVEYQWNVFVRVSHVVLLTYGIKKENTSMLIFWGDTFQPRFLKSKISLLYNLPCICKWFILYLCFCRQFLSQSKLRFKLLFLSYWQCYFSVQNISIYCPVVLANYTHNIIACIASVHIRLSVVFHSTLDSMLLPSSWIIYNDAFTFFPWFLFSSWSSIVIIISKHDLSFSLYLSLFCPISLLDTYFWI